MSGGASNRARPPGLWCFGRVRYDEAAYELRVDGLVVEVERKPLEVLSVLLDHAGKVVTKGDLVQLAWPGRVIGDAALAKSIARLREAIGDADHSLVRTHHRYGYRLVAEVQVQAPPPAIAVTVTTPAVATPAPQPHADAEHRVLTILFCDLVDSTRIAESLDPETYRTLLLDYQQRAADIVRRYEGYVAQQFGDGMLFWFGYPEAHDDDAERALRCACELLRFATRAGSYTHLSLRIGVHTGPVVIGRTGVGSAVQATGTQINLAARIQSLAQPDTILASDATFRLVPGLFVTRDFGPQAMRGMSEPVRVYQVLQPSGARSRLDVQARLTPFVGRTKEIALVESCWRDAVEGRGQTLVFTGEPGIGKSRLLMQLRTHLAGSAYTWLEGRSDALNRHSAFHVASELLRRGFGLQDSDSDAQRLLDLERRLDDLELDRDSTLPLLAPLLNLPLGERYPESTLAPEQKRARMLDTLTSWITRLAEEQPLVLVVEDLHWCDDSTLEFIGGLLANSASLPLLVVMTARPEFTPAWPSTPALHARELGALDRYDTERMLSELSADAPLSAGLTAAVIERAAGVPLFLEELARELGEVGAAGSADAVPESLHSLLRARLDRLGPARDLIQTLAVIGMECEHGLLQQVCGLDPPSLKSQLERLIDSGLIHVRGASPDPRYVFKHALIRDVAYATLLKSAKQRLHTGTAEAIESLHAHRLDEHFGELAHHCEQAGQIERAAGYAQRAGESAIRRSANREASVHLATAIRLLEALETTSARVTTLLSLYVSQVNALVAINGYLDPGASAAHLRACELSRAAEPSADLAAILFWIVATDCVRARHAAVIENAAPLDALGERIELPSASMAACFIASQSSTMLGRLEQAERYARRTIALYDPATHRDIAFTYGEDLLSSGAATLAWALWLRGYPDQATAERERSLTHARQLGHRFNLAIACTLNSFGLQLQREMSVMAPLAREAVTLCAEHNFPWYRAWAEVALAADPAGRDPSAAVAATRASLEVLNGGGALVFRPWSLTTLALMQSRTGELQDGLSTLEEALSLADATGENFYRAETLRLRGELLLQANADAAQAQAKSCFLAALEVARSQNARSLELRAATSLAHLLRDTNRSDEAHAALQPVYAWFTEGFDTPDLRDAAALLSELDQGR